ncbi:MAG: hypothetical protein KGL39_30235, partial [Patescibacteria group bacterium]|nr:hypothetical protein [Patescibacteria group bacterium]
AAGFMINGLMNIPSKPFVNYLHDFYSPSAFSLYYTTSQGGNVTMKVNWYLHWIGHGAAPGTPPDYSTFVLNATPSTHVTWSTANGASAGEYVLTATIAYAATAGDNTSIAFTVTPPANYQFDGNPFSDGEDGFIFPVQCSFSGSLPFVAENTRTALNALLPSGSAVQIKCAESAGDHQKFVMGIGALTGPDSYWADVTWTLSDTTVKGCWIANTLPVGGNNVFIDQDIPPYVGAIVEGPFNYTGSRSKIAVTGFGETDGSTANPLASAMRQAAPLNDSEINAVLPSLQPQPAQWLVRRDTDAVPFDLGFNTGYAFTIEPDQSAGGNYSINVPPNATSIIIRLMQRGTVPGWYNGQFQYGKPLAAAMEIYVRKGNPATPTIHDFVTLNGEVTIPNDGGIGYLDNVLNQVVWLLIEDPLDTGLGFDLLIQFNLGIPKRQYFPCDDKGNAVAECFSYIPIFDVNYHNISPPLILNSEDFSLSPDNSNFGSFKPVPRSGYCIFKVRATRLPTDPGTGILAVPASGDKIIVTLGQNVLKTGTPSPFTPPPGFGGPVGFGLGMGGGANMGMGGQVGVSSLEFVPFVNPDTSNLTITIPAADNTTGDVAVFIPCIDGNEMVWQAPEAVKVEVWANWQPIFFNNIYAQGQFPFDLAFGTPVSNQDRPLIYQYGFSFVNFFDPRAAGWTLDEFNAFAGAIPPVVQFPVGIEQYNDLYAALGLIT